MVLLRLLAGLAAAAIGVFVGLAIAAALANLLPEGAAQVLSAIPLIGVPAYAFVWTFRRLETAGERRRKVEGEIEDRKDDALDRKIAEKAQAIARGLAPDTGTCQSATLRVTGGSSPSIDALQDGNWVTVFAARYHPGKEGQVVPSGIREPRIPAVTPPKWYRPTWTVLTRTVGAKAAWWEILAYRPGPWEDELDPLVEAAGKAAFEAEKGRFGL
ncbi:MAG: hypothetical protein ABUT39_24945 [Acidobacteriota bacterium]